MPAKHLRPALVALTALAFGCGDDTSADTSATGSTSEGTATAASTATSAGTTAGTTAGTDTAGTATAGTTATTTAGETTTATTTTAGTDTDTDTGEPIDCVIRVDGASGDDGFSGYTWLFPKATVQAGVDAAAALLRGGEPGPCAVWVTEGLYHPSDADDPSASFVMAAGVAVYGGFVGGEASLDERDFVAHETVLSGEIGDPDGIDDNTRHVVLAADGARLDGVTVTGGYSIGGPGERDGAGILGIAGSFTVANARIVGNVTGDGGDGEVGTIGGSGGYGAGIYFATGSLTILDTLIADNTSGLGGAGSAVGGVGGEGTGLAFVNGVDLELRRVVFSGNHAGAGGLGNNVGGPGGSGAGAMILSAKGDVTIDGCTFNDNVGGDGGTSPNLGGPGGGGAVFVNASAGATIVRRARFESNVAGGGGPSAKLMGPAGSFGGLAFGGNSGLGGGIVVADSRFIDNTSSFASGIAILGESMSPAGSVDIVNCEVVDNVSLGASAGIMLRTNGQRAITLAHTTIAGNTATYQSGGLYYALQEPMGALRTRVVHSIVWGNSAAEGDDLHVTAFNVMVPLPLEIDRSVVGGGCVDTEYLTCGTVLADDPLFVDLVGGDVHLGAASPARDAGENTDVPADLADLDDDGDIVERTPLDLDEAPRIAGPAVDFGPYEAP